MNFPVHRISSCWTVLTLLSAFLVVDVITLRSNDSSGAETHAYAFLRNGDLWFQYKGEARAVTKKGLYKDFAVSNDGSYLALLGTVKEKPSVGQISVVSLGNVGSLPTIEVSTTTSLIATCGTIASVENNVALKGRVAIAKDLISREDFVKQDYVDFRCSSDKKVVIGYTGLDDRRLSVRGDLGKKVSLENVPNLFDLSIGGKFGAFYTVAVGSSHLCLWQTEGSSACLANLNVFDRVSVSDSGDVLFATHSGESCLFLDAEHYSTTPKPGYDTGDECPDVAHWHSGMRDPEVLQSLARHPQWLTDAAVSRLRAWRQQEF